MWPEEFNNIYIEVPKGLKTKYPSEKMPLSELYDNGYFISECFGVDAWVIDLSIYESQICQFVCQVPKTVITWIKNDNPKRYKRFLKFT